MAVVRWLLVGAAALAAAGAWIHHGLPARAASVARFACPMHPAVVSDQAAQCPVCGMDLVPVAAKRRSDAPRAEPGTAADLTHRFTCPMHPGFVTSDAEARCPECGMRLVPVPARDHPAPADAPGAVELSAGQMQLIGLRTAAARRDSFAPAIRAVGFVTADEAAQVSVSARFSGWVESVPAPRTGQPIEKGAVLATLYSPETLSAQQVFLSTRHWSERPGSALEEDARRKLLYLGIAPEDVERIGRKGEVETAVPVRAPARGYLARRGVVRGAYVQAGTELFQIVDLTAVSVLVDVAEGEAGRVGAGQPATFEAAAWPGETFRGRIDYVYPGVNPASRTLQARIALPNPDLRLRPGMFGQVSVEAPPEEALLVPRDALVDLGDEQYVFVAPAPGRFVPRRVRAGWTGDDEVVVREGLAEGEQVVAAASFLLDSESRLRAALDETSPRAPDQASAAIPAQARPHAP